MLAYRCVEKPVIFFEVIAETAPFAHAAENKNTIDAMSDVAFKEIVKTTSQKFSDVGMAAELIDER